MPEFWSLSLLLEVITKRIAMASTTELLPLMELSSVKLVMKMHIHITSLFVFAYYIDRQTDGQTDKLMKRKTDQTKRGEKESQIPD